MTKALRLRVTIVVDSPLLLLRTIVPGQLEQTFPAGHGVPLFLLHIGIGFGVAEEIKVEAGLLVLRGAHQGHAHHFLVEFQTGLGRLDPDHRVVQPVAAGVCGGSHILVTTTDDFHPVSIGILHKGNVPHATVRELLLKRIARLLKSLAGHLDVVDGDGQVAKTAVGFCVAVDHAVVGITLSAVVMSEFHHTVAVRPVAVTLERRGAVVGKEVEREFVLREVEVLDLVETKVLIELHYVPCDQFPVHNVWSASVRLLTRSLRVLDPEHCVCIAETSQSAPLIDQANLKIDRFTNG